MPTLSVILPTFNAASWLPDTLEHLRVAILRAGWSDVEIIVVDDGSTDETSTVLAADHGAPALSVVRQENGGRFRARQAGLAAATGELVLFIDSRVHAHPTSLCFIRDQLSDFPDRLVWNGHVVTAEGASPFSRFWDAITFLAWRKYLRSPRLTSYGVAEYDYYPKGTTFFLAPKDWLVEACAGFESSFTDLRHANDDTLLIRPIVTRASINMSPEFSCTYFPRDSARKFLAHSLHRGTVFVDGYYHPGTRFYRPLQLFAILAPVALVLGVRRPKLAVLALVAGSSVLGMGARVAGVPRKNALALGFLAPLFGIAYGLGISRGLALRIVDRRRP
ncbi:MAG: gtuS2-1 [Acidimicrobiaceae bacterium]|nr:MAG: gtuS2-1 [Acidimicrobiaceae bacterium]